MASIAESDSTGRTYSIPIPFDTPVNVSVLPGGFSIADLNGLAVASLEPAHLHYRPIYRDSRRAPLHRPGARHRSGATHAESRNSSTPARLFPLALLLAAHPLLAQPSLSVAVSAPIAGFSSPVGASQNFTFSLADSAGVSDINYASLTFGNTANSNTCNLIYFPTADTLSLNADSSSS